MKHLKLYFLTWFILSISHFGFSQNFYDNSIPYSTNDSTLTIWNGSEYIPFFMKGVNMGVAVPGTFPGQMAATRENYAKWFQDIKDAGFNSIRLYTLHFPRFYEVLDSFNLANPHNPLLFIQGVWLEEELPDYDNDLYFFTDAFTQEIEENIDCVHGNRTIPQRVGKAYGEYTTNVSRWCLAYIIGREVYPIEILTTDEHNSGINSFTGNHLAINDASPSEVWFTKKLNHTISYQQENYGTQRPVSNSSWPTLDPIEHPEEQNPEEDTAQIDLAKIEIIDAPAGIFISYHAYPYYPDFISLQSSYQSYFDDYGPNSYLGYLKELRSHYEGIPLIIAEYGVPSSWIIAHYATSGMNHGGFDEHNQGITNLRMLETIRSAGSGGGILFAWIDEWFKRTWVTDPVDYIADSRILWHNISAAEQNYGLISFHKTHHNDTLVTLNPNNDITYINTEINYAFFELEIGLSNPLDIPDEMWIALDTYSEDLGESILPNGDTIPSRSEFAIYITNYSAKLYVTQAYDIFAIWHNWLEPGQLYRSIATDGAPWKIVRIRNNYTHSDVQYTGNLQLNYGFQPQSSKDAVTIFDDKIKVRIPWSYLNMVSPDQMKVLHDYQEIPGRQDTISDGFVVSLNYKDQWYYNAERLVWEPWVYIDGDDIEEKYKQSYYVMKNNLHNFNTPAIAVRDSLKLFGPDFPIFVDHNNGLMANDFDLDGELMISLIVEPPKNGNITMYSDGSFIYQPEIGFNGYDSIQYAIFDGHSLSKSNTAVFEIIGNTSNIHDEFADLNDKISVYPNPASSIINIESKVSFDEILIFNSTGVLVESFNPYNDLYTIDISNYSNGVYLIVALKDDKHISKKVIKQ